MIGDQLPEIPDLVEPITAWRCWIVTGDKETPILRSPVSFVVWPPVRGWQSKVVRGEQRNFITAECKSEEDCTQCPSPTHNGHRGSGCGIYAYKTIDKLSYDWPLPGLPRHHKDNQYFSKRMVWGKALLWGKVYEHDYGYRAEFARIHSIVKVPSIGDITEEELQKISSFYGIELEILDLDKDYFEEIAVARQKTIVKTFFKTIKQIIKGNRNGKNRPTGAQGALAGARTTTK